MTKDFIKIPKTFVIRDDIIKYDYKSMRDYFDSILKAMGEDMNNKDKLALFKQLVSEISIKRYSQEEYVDVINAIYKEIYKEKTNDI
tara:strand:- start:2334 stop:2594 length:261 start_codon:yes stop_codon:yes gene_type:complete